MAEDSKDWNTLEMAWEYWLERETQKRKLRIKWEKKMTKNGEH